jgi:hypothetical protein
MAAAWLAYEVCAVLTFSRSSAASCSSSVSSGNMKNQFSKLFPLFAQEQTNFEIMCEFSIMAQWLNGPSSSSAIPPIH